VNASEASVLLRCWKRGDVREIGCLMAASHDGDRVVAGEAGEPRFPFSLDFSDSALDARVARNANLLYESGTYACSTEEIDALAETANAVPGVIGAQLSGAGLGGCIMVLVEEDAIRNLIKCLEKHYYKPRELEAKIYSCVPVEGAGLLRFSPQEVSI
jgi:N-acetylgalactosamine kinase